MAVIHQRVAHARIGQIGRQLGLPDPLGEPEPAGFHPEAALDRLVHPADLLHPVRPGQRGEHRLVEAGQEHLDLPVGGETGQAIEIGGLVPLQPLEQRPREVQHDGEEVALAQPVEQRAIDVIDVLGEDVVEVADRLMQVQSEDEADRVGHQRNTRVREPPSAAATADSTSGKRSSRRPSSSARVCAPASAVSPPVASPCSSDSASRQCSLKRRSA